MCSFYGNLKFYSSQQTATSIFCDIDSLTGCGVWNEKRESFAIVFFSFPLFSVVVNSRLIQFMAARFIHSIFFGIFSASENSIHLYECMFIFKNNAPIVCYEHSTTNVTCECEMRNVNLIKYSVLLGKEKQQNLNYTCRHYSHSLSFWHLPFRFASFFWMCVFLRKSRARSFFICVSLCIVYYLFVCEFEATRRR